MYYIVFLSLNMFQLLQIKNIHKQQCWSSSSEKITWSYFQKIGIHDADIHSDLMGSKYNTRIRMQNLKSIGKDKRYSINNTHAGFKNIDLSIA